MLANKLTEVLRSLNSSSAEIEASAVVSIDGLTMASALSEGIDEDRVGAMTEVMVKGERGYVLLASAGPEAVLVVVASEGAKLGLVFLDAKRAAAKVAESI